MYWLYSGLYLSGHFLLSEHVACSSEGVIQQDEGVGLNIKGQVRTKKSEKCWSLKIGFVLHLVYKYISRAVLVTTSHLAATMAPKTIISTL